MLLSPEEQNQRQEAMKGSELCELRNRLNEAANDALSIAMGILKKYSVSVLQVCVGKV